MTLCEFDPPGFRPEFTVVSAYLMHRGKFLVVLRHPDKHFGNTWSLPGGKAHEGESLQEAISREVEEELGVCIAAGKFAEVDRFDVRQQHYDFVYVEFETVLDEVPELTLKLDENTDSKWVTPEEAVLLELVPGEEHCIRDRFGL